MRMKLLSVHALHYSTFYEADIAWFKANPYRRNKYFSSIGLDYS